MSLGVETCSTERCHPTQGRFTHPVGKDIIDPRSGSSLDCSTCHNPMGSPEEYILRDGKDRDLCIKCHQV
jgi:predicted CXXCH cytochrome family protein